MNMNNSPVDETTYVSDDDTGWEVADVLDDRLRGLPLHERVPGVPDHTRLAHVRMGTRMQNVFGRERLTVFADIRSLTVNDLLALRGAGNGSVQELLTGLRAAAAAPNAPGPSPEPAAAPATPPWQDAVIADLQTLARWHRIVGSEDVSVLSKPDDVVEPDVAVAARARILALAAADLLPEAPDGGAAAAAVEAVLGDLDERALAVVRDRIMADDPVNLDTLGGRYSVTRERIRQIEAKLITQLGARTHEGDLHSLATIAAGAIGSLIGLRTLVQRHPTLGEQIPSIGQPVWRFLDRLDDEYEIKDGWCARGTVAEAVSRTKEQLTRLAGDRAFVELAAVDDPGLELSLEWLQYCGVTVLRGCALPGRAGINDRAEVVLHAQQEQMSAEDICAALGVERSVRSLRNQLADDPRFARVDRDDWALTAWGLTGYLPIRAMISRSLSAAGGEMPLDDLIADITRRFDVSSRSIVHYATAFPFITDKGIVRRRVRRDMRRPRRKGFVQTRALYRLPDAVKLRIVVNSEHLRGSGSALPNALGEEIDLSVAEAKNLERAIGGTILVSWRGPQITLGSVRADVEQMGLTEGDPAFFVFATDGSFRLEPVAESEGIDDRLLALTGGPSADGGDVWRTIADRIDSAADDRDAVLAALSARGDAQLVEIASTSSAFSAG